MSANFNVWLNGAPVVQIGTTSDFSVWLNGAPVISMPPAAPGEMFASFCGESCFTADISSLVNITSSFCGESCFTGDARTIASASATFCGEACFAGDLTARVSISGNFCGETCFSGDIAGDGAITATFCGETCFSGTAHDANAPVIITIHKVSAKQESLRTNFHHVTAVQPRRRSPSLF